MRTPRDITGNELATLLKRYGYEIARQKGSHIRITKNFPKEHHITIPNHNPIKIGTLSSILTEIAQHLGITKENLIQDLFQ